MKWTTDRFNEFLDGFASGAGLDRKEADAQWAGYSRQLSDNDRQMIESGGKAAGKTQGKSFAKLYPDSIVDQAGDSMGEVMGGSVGGPAFREQSVTAKIVCGSTVGTCNGPCDFNGTYNVTGNGFHHAYFARLIEAIPQMLDACREALEDMQSDLEALNWTPDCRKIKLEILEKLERAIEKAEGR